LSSGSISTYLVWEVIVDYNVHTLNVNATANKVSGHQYALVELLEVLDDSNAAQMWKQQAHKKDQDIG
jgi:hypothetical protein